MHPSIPAIANAIYDAIGVRMDRLPFTPPNVWRTIEQAREAGTLSKPAAPGVSAPAPGVGVSARATSEAASAD